MTKIQNQFFILFDDWNLVIGYCLIIGIWLLVSELWSLLLW